MLISLQVCESEFLQKFKIAANLQILLQVLKFSLPCSETFGVYFRSVLVIFSSDWLPRSIAIPHCGVIVE